MIPPSVIDYELDAACFYADDKPYYTITTPRMPLMSATIPMMAASATTCAINPDIFAFKKARELNCPNCGAPISRVQCEYCGTFFVDPYILEKEKKELEMERIRLEMESQVHEMQQTITTNQYQFSLDDKSNNSLIKKILKRR